MGPNLDLIKAFICNDGKDWNSTTMTAAKDFTLDSLIATRDPRFEASFYHKPTENAKSCGLYVTKFIHARHSRISTYWWLTSTRISGR